ncbi:hypothetical protein E6O75_ATG06931 [Venturia nashicola]|uniref:Uncharacterized protein n=1 Tax=Venturia nashicola TaxID=86259 RepID=A0A4Z1P5F2_9PEZI|nr:hypothetical protein E6O75_ATG06931 [Venturia nashicola]
MLGEFHIIHHRQIHCPQRSHLLVKVDATVEVSEDALILIIVVYVHFQQSLEFVVVQRCEENFLSHLGREVEEVLAVGFVVAGVSVEVGENLVFGRLQVSDKDVVASAIFVFRARNTRKSDAVVSTVKEYLEQPRHFNITARRRLGLARGRRSAGTPDPAQSIHTPPKSAGALFPAQYSDQILSIPVLLLCTLLFAIPFSRIDGYIMDERNLDFVDESAGPRICIGVRER